MKNAFYIAGISLCALFIFTAPLLNGFANYSLDNWAFILGGRVIIGFVLSMWAGYAFGKMIEFGTSGVIYSVIAMFFASFLLNIFPILDLINGPMAVEGKLDGYFADHYLDWRPGAMYSRIDAGISLQDENGEVLDLSTSGWQANRIENALEGCNSDSKIHGFVLKYMDHMIELRCKN